MRAPLIRFALLLGLGTLLVAGGAAAAVPAAVTGSASAITSASATLNGTVDPGGQPT